jgi:hypothetical protein
LAQFDVDIVAFANNEYDLAAFDFLFSADQAMSLPVLPEEDMRYSMTQLIADAARQSGYDGVTFRSSVGEGQNICVFDPAALAYVEGSAVPIHVKALKYQLDTAPAYATSDPDDYRPLDE